MLRIDDVRAYCANDTIILTEHLLTRMRQRHIKLEDIKNAIAEGEIIEQYPIDYPFPSCLVNAENIHVVCSVGEGSLYIITAYRPTPEQWQDGGRKRKEKTLWNVEFVKRKWKKEPLLIPKTLSKVLLLFAMFRLMSVQNVETNGTTERSHPNLRKLLKSSHLHVARFQLLTTQNR